MYVVVTYYSFNSLSTKCFHGFTFFNTFPGRYRTFYFVRGHNRYNCISENQFDHNDVLHMKNYVIYNKGRMQFDVIV